MRNGKIAIIILLFLIDKGLQYYAIAPKWVQFYADDILLMPIIMGTALWLQQKLVNPTFTFNTKQVIGTWLFFSILFEGIYPVFIKAYTRDIYDVLAYGLGAIIFAKWMNQGATNSMA
jgi:hypothetical protein